MHKKMVALVLLLSASLGAGAQEFPQRPVKFVVGFAPGGGADNAARSMAQKMSEAWGQPVVIDNRAGAGGNLAAEMVSKATPDGYTMLVSSPGPIVTSPYLYEKLSYDPLKELIPITLIGSGANVMVVNPSSPATNAREFIAWARSKAGGLNYATSGIGSTPHLAAELFKAAGQIDMVHVPYKSAAPALLDVIAGRADVIIVSMPTTIGQIRAGKVRAILVAAPKRSALLPDVPTSAEAGMPGFEVVTWWGFFATAGVPGSIISRANQFAVKALHSIEMKESLAREGADAIGNSPAEFAAFIQQESVKWARVIKGSSIKAE